MKVVRTDPPEGGAAGGAQPGGPSLDDLAGQAERLQQEHQDDQAGAAPGAVKQPTVTNATLIAGALEMTREVLCVMWKLQSPRTTFTTDDATKLGDVWGKVCDARGINLEQYMGAFTLECAAVYATFQIGMAVRAGVIQELAQRKAAAGEATGAPPASNDAHG